MKNLKIYMVFLLVVFILACTNKETIEQTIQHEKSLQAGSIENQQKVSEPGIYPSDHDLMKLRYSAEGTSWQSFYRYFNDELPKYKTEHYYDNLEWMNLSFILSDASFAREADDETKELLWSIIAQRDFVNEPRHAISLLKSMQTTLDPYTFRDRLFLINEINNNFFKNQPENYKKFKEVHHSDLDEILTLTYLISLTGKYPTYEK